MNPLDLPLGFLAALFGIGVAVVNPGHVFNNGKGTFGCERSKGLGYYSPNTLNGGQYYRNQCVKDGQVVWCDEVCPRSKKGRKW